MKDRGLWMAMMTEESSTWQRTVARASICGGGRWKPVIGGSSGKVPAKARYSWLLTACLESLRQPLTAAHPRH